MKKILVTTISYVNDKRPGSEIYTTYAKRLINDVLTKTPYDIMVSTNRSDLFKEFDDVEMVCIKQVDLVDHKTHVGAFNQLLKFSALQCIDSEYDWVLYLDCDFMFSTIGPIQFTCNMYRVTTTGFPLIACVVTAGLRQEVCTRGKGHTCF